MAQLNDFMTRIDLSVLNDYVVANGVSSNMLQEAYCRYLNMLVKTPTEHFHELVSRYPGVIHNPPIQEIASYVGISRRQLHRIREAESAADASECEDI